MIYYNIGKMERSAELFVSDYINIYADDYKNMNSSENDKIRLEKTKKHNFDKFYGEMDKKYKVNESVKTIYDNIIINNFTFHELNFIMKDIADKVINFDVKIYDKILVCHFLRLLISSIGNVNNKHHHLMCEYLKNKYDQDIVEIMELNFVIDKKYKGCHKILKGFFDLINVCDIYSVLDLNIEINKEITNKKINFVSKIIDLLFVIFINIGEDIYYDCVMKIYNIKLILKLDNEICGKILVRNSAIFLRMKELLRSFNNELFYFPMKH
jgi:hypothetical protein